MFVFDVSDTEAERDAPMLPRDVTHPFEVRGGIVGAELEATIETAKRGGIRVMVPLVSTSYHDLLKSTLK
jgi:hypothetical protein